MAQKGNGDRDSGPSVLHAVSGFRRPDARDPENGNSAHDHGQRGEIVQIDDLTSGPTSAHASHAQPANRLPFQSGNSDSTYSNPEESSKHAHALPANEEPAQRKYRWRFWRFKRNRGARNGGDDAQHGTEDTAGMREQDLRRVLEDIQLELEQERARSSGLERRLAEVYCGLHRVSQAFKGVHAEGRQSVETEGNGWAHKRQMRGRDRSCAQPKKQSLFRRLFCRKERLTTMVSLSRRTGRHRNTLPLPLFEFGSDPANIHGPMPCCEFVLVRAGIGDEFLVPAQDFATEWIDDPYAYWDEPEVRKNQDTDTPLTSETTCLTCFQGMLVPLYLLYHCCMVSLKEGFF
jgi:hypothetical protein